MVPINFRFVFRFDHSFLFRLYILFALFIFRWQKVYGLAEMIRMKLEQRRKKTKTEKKTASIINDATIGNFYRFIWFLFSHQQRWFKIENNYFNWMNFIALAVVSINKYLDALVFLWLLLFLFLIYQKASGTFLISSDRRWTINGRIVLFDGIL